MNSNNENKEANALSETIPVKDILSTMIRPSK